MSAAAEKIIDGLHPVPSHDNFILDVVLLEGA
jgi:hypothetical protein